ncbi:alpha/beta fold hydrolase [Halomarina rubra]|uniref:Alpha/beta fold hydrolase n=1 Tax=Halomarina rubra TaxID=2071873 RepID=A0ABD6ARI3_9EURY|nr:alpha/beta hydrolase [Halomarina rubra]
MSDDTSLASRVADESVETGTVHTNGIETYYERRGDGPPVVFVHAMATSTALWTAQATALADEFTTVVYDVRGHGHTGGSDHESYSMALYAEDLDALLDALAIERPVLCGLSMGGAIAQVYAARHPERVAGVVLADTFTAAPLPRSSRLVFSTYRVLGRLDRFVRYTTLNRAQLWVGRTFAPGVEGDGVTIQRVMEDAPTIPHDEFRKIIESVADFPDSDFDASAITVPTLVLHGENLPGAIQVMTDRLLDRLVNAPVETAVVPGGGHASNVDNPAFFTERVREFAAERFVEA